MIDSEMSPQRKVIGEEMMSNLKTIILPKEIHSFYLPLPLIQQNPVYHKQNVG